MITTSDKAVFASLESLIQDQYQTYRLTAFPNRKTSRVNNGNYRSIFKGRGMDFDEVREYQQGDDVRLVDWRITARHGKTYTKVFKEERDRQVWFLLDFRHSMHFATRQAFKSVIAAHLAAMTAWFFKEKGDKIGGILLSDKTMQLYKPSRLHRKLIQFLANVSEMTRSENSLKPIQEEVSLSTACWKLRRSCRNGNLIFIISDFSDVNEDTFKSLSSLAKRNEVILINVFDELEGKCPIPNVYPITNGEKMVALDTRHFAVQKAYMNYFEKRHLSLKEFASTYHIHYVPISTGMDFYDTFAQSLRRRRRK